MANNIRFIDSLRVGAYTAVDSGTTGSIVIDNNINNYVLTATGTDNISGESNLQFDGINLGIGGPSSGARFEINDTTGNDLLLIKNSSNRGIKVDSEGIFQLLTFNSFPTAVDGGIIFYSGNFYLGL